MKVKHILLALIAIFFAGECMSIKAFDDYGLKELNNRLTSYEKVIQKLSRQVLTGTAQAVISDDDEYEEGGYSDSLEPSDPTIVEPVDPTVPVEEMTKKQIRQAKQAARKAAREAKKAARKAAKGELATKSIMAGSDTGYGAVEVPVSQAVGYMQPGGRVDLYSPNKSESVVINIAPTSYVGKGTQARIAIPSIYYRDLKGIYLTSSTQKYTADYLTLQNASGDTIALTGIDETNDINDVQADSIAGKRDQSDVFADETWVYFFIIYNPTSADVSSLSSESATAPTLPTGYTFYAKVGAVYHTTAGGLRRAVQIDNEVFIDSTSGQIFTALAPGGAGTWESVSIAGAVPPTAKVVSGMMGTASGSGSKSFGVASDSTGYTADYMCATAGIYGFKWKLPVVTSQTIWWEGSTTDAIYFLVIKSYQDDL